MSEIGNILEGNRMDCCTTDVSLYERLGGAVLME